MVGPHWPYSCQIQTCLIKIVCNCTCVYTMYMSMEKTQDHHVNLACGVGGTACKKIRLYTVQ